MRTQRADEVLTQAVVAARLGEQVAGEQNQPARAQFSALLALSGEQFAPLLLELSNFLLHPLESVHGLPLHVVDDAPILAENLW